MGIPRGVHTHGGGGMTPKERQKRQGMKGSERGVGKIVPADEDRGANIFLWGRNSHVRQNFLNIRNCL